MTATNAGINTLNFYLSKNSNFIFVTSPSNAISPGRWYHVTATYNGNSNSSGVNLYINGAPVATTSVLNNLGTNSILNTGPALIGADCGGVSNKFDGTIDDLRVYNRALTADETTGLYNLGQVKINKTRTDRTTSGLLGHWTLDGPQRSATQALDISPNISFLARTLSQPKITKS